MSTDANDGDDTKSWKVSFFRGLQVASPVYGAS